MKRKNAVIVLAACLILGTTCFGASQPVNGVEHWVNNGAIRLYVWEKYVGTPKDKPIIVLAHGSATAGKESFDLQVPGKPTYSLMDVLAENGFDVFALDVRGFGRSTHPDGHMTTAEASQDLNAVVDYVLKLRERQEGQPARLVLGDPVRRDVRDEPTGEGGEVRLLCANAH